MAGILAGLLGSFPVASGAYELIATTVISGTTTTTVTFSDGGAWSAYRHLQIRAIARTVNTINSMERIALKFNNSSTNTYSTHRLYGNGSSVSLSSGTTGVQMYVGYSPRGSISSAYAASIIDVLDFSSSGKNKTVKSIGGYYGSGQYEVGIQSGLYYSTTPVTSITLYDGGGYAFSANTRFSLYGIKG